MSLDQRIARMKMAEVGFLPQLFDLRHSDQRDRFEGLFENRLIHCVVDDYEQQLSEYYALLHPDLVSSNDFDVSFREYVSSLQSENGPLLYQGTWVYYPWSCTVAHVLDESSFYAVRVSRNRNLITEDEQMKFYDAVVGIVGLSIGNSVALALVLQGGSKHIKLADFDTLALSNLNRVRSGVPHLGLSKAVLTARQIYELNPYASVDVYSEGLCDSNCDVFFSDLDVVVDEVDNLAVKYRIREYAQKYRIPVVMGADVGDGAIVDIERYDVYHDLPFFHGRLSGMSYDSLSQLDLFEIGKAIVDHLSVENIPFRVFDSFFEIGKTLVSWPQLGGAALLNGSVVAYCVRKIVIADPLISTRGVVSLDYIFVPNYSLEEEVNRRAERFEEYRDRLAGI